MAVMDPAAMVDRGDGGSGDGDGSGGGSDGDGHRRCRWRGQADGGRAIGQDGWVSIKKRCVECRCSFRPRRAEQRLCGRIECRRGHHNRLVRFDGRNDLAQSRTDERRRQAEHRARKEAVIAPGRVRMSRTRSEAEVVDMVEEIQKSWQALGGGRCSCHAPGRRRKVRIGQRKWRFSWLTSACVTHRVGFLSS
jgi:hypothetical protein